MKKSPYTLPITPANESDRLLALFNFKVLDTPPDMEIDDITLLASKICGTPIALVSLIDEKRQWFKSHHGLDATETPRDMAFCAHAINQDEIFIVEDAHLDERFKENPLVTGGPKVRFYAGSQLKTSDGFNIGTLCVIDHEAKSITKEQSLALDALARQVILNFEHKILEYKLREREKFLGNIVGMLPDLVCYVSTEFQCQYINPSFEKWFNTDLKNITGKPIKEVFGIDAFHLIRPNMEKALQGEEQRFQSFLPFSVKGNVVNKAVQSYFIPDVHPDRKVHGFFAVMSDVSQIKEAEQKAIKQSLKLDLALKQSIANEKSFRAIFDNSPIGIVQVDSQLRFVATNPSFASFIGYSEIELKKMTILDITSTEDLEIAKSLTIDQTRFEKRFVHKSGAIIWGLLSTKAISFEAHGEKFIFLIVEDITEIRKAELEHKETQEKLISSSKMASLGEMASGVAHEINNPLAIISGKTELLAMKISSGNLDTVKILADLASITNTTDRIATIIKGLKLFSRNSIADAMSVNQLSTIINETTALCLERFKNNSIDFKINCSKEYPVECRPTEISQIIMNCLTNSFDAIQSLDNKWISLDVTGNDKFVNIIVTDSGQGIDAKIVDKIMNPFFTTKDVGRGTGLGLSISKGIAESHNGSLKFDNSQSNTTFVLELPIKQPSKFVEKKAA